MARSRNIKPAFFSNDKLAELSPLDRLFFIGLWTISDFKGDLEYRPKRLKAQLLPYDDCKIEEIVNNLDKSRFISIHSLLGISYIHISNFNRHQNPHPNERKSGSIIPQLVDSKGVAINHDSIVTNRADSLIPHPDSLNPSKEEKTSFFNNFYSLYPKKTTKQETLTYCLTKLDINEDFEKILMALDEQIEHKKFLKEKGEFVPEFQDPIRWLKKKRWEDEITVVPDYDPAIERGAI